MGDDLPEIELIEPDREHSEVDVATVRSSRHPVVNLAVVAVVMLAALAAAAAVAGGGDDDPDDEAGTTTTTGPVDSTSRGEAVDPVGAAALVGTHLAGDPAPVLGRAVDAQVLVGGASDPWLLVDLDSGLVQEVPALDAQEPLLTIVPIAGGVVYLDGDTGGLFLPLPDGQQAPGTVTEPARIPVPGRNQELLQRVTGILPADHAGGSFWLATETVGPVEEPGPNWRRMTIDGGLHAGPFEMLGRPATASDLGVVVNAGGRSYLGTDAGIEALDPGGPVLAAQGTRVARLVCGDDARCAPEVLDVRTGETWTGEQMPIDRLSVGDVGMSLSADGVLLTTDNAGGWTSEPGPTRPEHELRGTLFVTQPSGRNDRLEFALLAAPAWLPEGRGALLLTTVGVVHLTFDPQDGVEQRRIADLPIGDADTLVVVPDR